MESPRGQVDSPSTQANYLPTIGGVTGAIGCLAHDLEWSLREILRINFRERHGYG